MGKTSVFSALMAALVVMVSATASAAPDSDFLAKQSIAIDSKDAQGVLNRTLADVRGVFERYKVALDDSTKIKSPLRVSGTRMRPLLQVSLEKCVLFVCETVDLEADIQVIEGRGDKCDRSFVVAANLSKSSRRLTDIYDVLNVDACFNQGQNGQGKLDLSASAHRARTYQQGMIQKQIFDLLQLQIRPMVKALNDALKANQ